MGNLDLAWEDAHKLFQYLCDCCLLLHRVHPDLKRALLLTDQGGVALQVRHVKPRVAAAEVLVIDLEEPPRYIQALEDEAGERVQRLLLVVQVARAI